MLRQGLTVLCARAALGGATWHGDPGQQQEPERRLCCDRLSESTTGFKDVLTSPASLSPGFLVYTVGGEQNRHTGSLCALKG